MRRADYLILGVLSWLLLYHVEERLIPVPATLGLLCLLGYALELVDEAYRHFKRERVTP